MSGYKVWADLEVLEATDLNSYLMAQAVPRFADATARGAAIATPAVGQLCYVTGVGFQVYAGGEWRTVVPPGGTTGQVLAKASNDDFDLEWITP